MSKQARVSFHSTAFPVAPDEDEETNPGLYGHALAQWLAERLRAGGRAIGEVYAEDYGWVFDVEDPRHRVHVACMNDDGSVERWLILMSCGAGFFARVMGKDQSSAVLDGVLADVRRSLHEHPGVSEIQDESA